MNNTKIELLAASLLHDLYQLSEDDLSPIIFVEKMFGSSQLLTDSVKSILSNLYNKSSDTMTSIISSSSCIANSLYDDRNYSGKVKNLKSVFNTLNGNNSKFYIKPTEFSLGNGINIPIKDSIELTPSQREQLLNNITSEISEADFSFDGINTILDSLEKNTSNIAFDNQSGEAGDISLYDHLKMTAAISTCLFDYLSDANTANEFGSDELLGLNSMILYSMDFSGIQDFIYTISSKGALKMLRARSFYLEILMENMIDDLLVELEISRANLIYSGGGHCYILIPNISANIEKIRNFNNRINAWLIENFDVSLYVADGYSICSGKTLNNVPSGSYTEIFKTISSSISEQKSCRYSASQILSMNNKTSVEGMRECSVCKKVDILNKEDHCRICSSIKNFSSNILHDDLFVISNKSNGKDLPLPGNKYLTSTVRSSFDVNSFPDYVRIYSKNEDPLKIPNSSKIWVGSYTSDQSFEEMADASANCGRIKRIGVVRADIDNLGTAFVNGFEKNTSIARTATLSRQLTAFFKLYINGLLVNPVFKIDNRQIEASRNATICYSGGDDLFIVGAWDEVIELMIDIREKFKEYTQNTLTISAGIGIYSPTYPISRIAYETAEMENNSKSIVGKDGITLFEDGCYHEETDSEGHNLRISDGTYKWDVFINNVLNDKYKTIATYFDKSEQRGKNFLYNILELIRNQEDRINFARYVYLISRLEPAKNSSEEEKQLFKEFSNKMYEWVKSKSDCRELKTAFNLYAYMIRQEGNNEY